MASFAVRLDALEAALSGTPSYAAVVAALRGLKAPTDVSAAELSRLYVAMFDLLGVQPSADRFSALDKRQRGHVQAWAGEIVEWTIYDPHRRQREWPGQAIRRLPAALAII